MTDGASPSGQQWAARCHAALPDPAAKAAAWAAVVGDASLSNRLVELTALGGRARVADGVPVLAITAV